MNIFQPSGSQSRRVDLLLGFFQWVGTLCLGLSMVNGLAGCDAKTPPSEKKEADKGSGGFVLFSESNVPPPIIIFQDAPPRTKAAAGDLADYIEKVTGSRPDILFGEPDQVPERAIWVGYQPILEKRFPGLDFKFEYPEEILIAANEENLVIAGRDRWDKEHMDIPGSRGSLIKDVQQEYGTANAISTFIQEYLNVRWLWPGKTGEDVIKQDSVVFAPFTYRYHPQFLARAELFRLSALGDSRGHSQDWVREQRLQLDSLSWDGGHPFKDWWEKYHLTHPEYFALQPDGTRSGFPSPIRAKECFSSPAVWDQWLAETEEELKIDPLKRVFAVSPSDSWASGHCVCANCVAWDNPKGRKFTDLWKGSEKEGVAISDRLVTFWNHLAAKVKERFPDKEIFLNGMAYGNSRPAPLSAVPDERIIIGGIFNTYFQAEKHRQKSRQDFQDWAKLSPIVWRPNLWVEVGAVGLPQISLRETMENFRFAAEHHCIGVFFDSTWENWATLAPQYYLMAQMAWNPYLDGEAVMDDYYQRGFGPAAPEVRKYWEGMEKAWDRAVEKLPSNPVTGRVRFFQNLDQVKKEVYTSEFFSQSQDLLKQAAAKIATSPEIYRERLALVQAGLTFTELMMENLMLMQEVEKTKGQDAKSVADAKVAWEKIDALIQEFPDAFNRPAIQRSVVTKTKKEWRGLFPYLGQTDKQKNSADAPRPDMD